jgi:hypothetical protein
MVAAIHELEPFSALVGVRVGVRVPPKGQGHPKPSFALRSSRGETVAALARSTSLRPNCSASANILFIFAELTPCTVSAFMCCLSAGPSGSVGGERRTGEATRSCCGQPADGHQSGSTLTSMSAPSKPNLLQYIGYCYGRRLPDSMRNWVSNDLAGNGATIRTMVRAAIPALLVLSPFWFIPMSLYLHLSTTLPIFIPFVLFSHALNKVWRRHRLRQHGLDPNLVDELSREKNAHIHQAYIEKYGPRSGPSGSHDV